MKKVEKESLYKSFLLFFILQTILVGALFYKDYKKGVQGLDEQIFSKMRLCSYSLKCKEFQIAFVPSNKYELYTLYKSGNSLSSFFPIPNATKNNLKIYLLEADYLKRVDSLQKEIFLNFSIVLIIIFLISIVFSIYTLSPLRNALHLTEEFIKDILHDFNTPLSVLRLNSTMLKDEIGENPKIKRMQNSIQNILNLQSNLRAYLQSHATQKESFELGFFLKERIDLIEANYKSIKFIVNNENINIEVDTNKDSFARIVDNLLSNAAKYNNKDGTVTIKFQNNNLLIEDTGRGIKNPKKVFDRFYKEQARGIGIGLHIVKKLCEELDINISLQSKVGQGSTFILNLQKIIKK